MLKKHVKNVTEYRRNKKETSLLESFVNKIIISKYRKTKKATKHATQ